MNAIVCACGRRLESDVVAWRLHQDLQTPTHNPDECSRQIAYEGRFDGRREMALAAVDHLAERRSLSGEELAEIRTNLLDLVTAMPMGPR